MTTGNWTTISPITLLPTPDVPTVTNRTTDSVTISVTNNAETADDFWVERMVQDDRYARGFGAATWEVATHLPAGTTTTKYTDTDLETFTSVQYRVVVSTEHSTATSGAVATSTRVEYGPHYTLELRKGVDIVPVYAKDMHDVMLPDEHSVINDWEISLRDSPGFEDWTRAEAYIWYNGQLLRRGEFESASTGRGVTTLSGLDVTRKLKRGGARHVYTSEPVWKAVQHYIDTYTEFDATVHEPSSTTIDEDLVVQEGSATVDLEEIFAPTETEPFAVQSDQLDLLPTVFLKDGLNQDRTNALSFDEDPNYTDGEAFFLTGSGSYVEYDVVTEHTISEAEVGVALRAAGSDIPSHAVKLDGQVLDSYDDGGSEGNTINLDWHEYSPNTQFGGSGWGGGDLEPGTHTIRIEATSGSGAIAIDIPALFDARYTDPADWDNDNGGSGGHLDTPRLFNPATITTTPYSSTFNITGTALTVALDDTSGAQQLEVSNDGGATWIPTDASGQNTETIDVDFASYGTAVRARVTLDGYGSRSSETPKTGINGQAISSWDLAITTNDLAVLDEREYVGSHYENVQQLVKDGGLRFVTPPTEGTPTVEVFERGAIVKSADWTYLDHERNYDTTDYANSVTVWGAFDEEADERLKATAKSEDAIADDGEEIEAPPLFEPKIDNEPDLRSLARTELSSRLNEDQLSGTVEIVPRVISAGYSYPVPELDGEVLSLERVEFGDMGQPNGSLDFEEATDLATAMSGITSNVKSVKDAF